MVTAPGWRDCPCIDVSLGMRQSVHGLPHPCSALAPCRQGSALGIQGSASWGAAAATPRPRRRRPGGGKLQQQRRGGRAGAAWGGGGTPPAAHQRCDAHSVLGSDVDLLGMYAWAAASGSGGGPPAAAHPRCASLGLLQGASVAEFGLQGHLQPLLTPDSLLTCTYHTNPPSLQCRAAPAGRCCAAWCGALLANTLPPPPCPATLPAM